MNQYVTGELIRKLREEKKLTQAELAEKLGVSDKAVSRWETGRGYPDITMLEPLAVTLNTSAAALLAGADVANRNSSGNMLRCKLYRCPVCGNVMWALGEASVSCCGIALPPLEAEPAEGDPAHALRVEQVEDEYYVTMDHPMEKEHFITFLAAQTVDGFSIRKLYPEGNAEARFKISLTRSLYCCCNRHSLFRLPVARKPR